MITTSYGSKHLETVDGADSGNPYEQCPAADGKLIELWQHDKLYVIVEMPSGQYYTNQTHGNACNHPIAEGMLVMLEESPTVPHVGCWGGIDADDAKLLNSYISRYGIEVDFSRVGGDAKDSNEFGEAWVPVEGAMKGILTWPNCD